VIRESIETLFQRLLLGDPGALAAAPEKHEYDYALSRAVDILQAKVERLEAEKFEFRLRLALHLSPASAIKYDTANPVPRHRLIRSFLQERFGRTGDLVEQLARDVAQLLAAWDESRTQLAGYAPSLLARQKGRCGHCHVTLTIPPPEHPHVIDEYKPYYLSPAELLAPEVDHIEAISSLGTNELRNLQVLCRLCNAGKGDGLGLNVRHEVSHAGEPIKEIEPLHRCRMLFYVISREGQTCGTCGSRTSELTIRPIDERGGFVRTNLRSVCYSCLQIG
jgi:5-methylcytosine-specific restriction endonuclease McrA